MSSIPPRQTVSQVTRGMRLTTEDGEPLKIVRGKARPSWSFRAARRNFARQLSRTQKRATLDIAANRLAIYMRDTQAELEAQRAVLVAGLESEYLEASRV